MVYAIDFATGKIAWQREAHRGVPAGSAAPEEHLRVRDAGHRRHSASTCRSATSASSPYDFNGKVVWSKPVELQPTRNGWGTAASPVLHNGRLYFVNDNDGAS